MIPWWSFSSLDIPQICPWSNVLKILAIDPKMMTIDPKMMIIDLKMMMIDPNMMTIDPNMMTIDPNIMMIDQTWCFYKKKFADFLNNFCSFSRQQLLILKYTLSVNIHEYSLFSPFPTKFIVILNTLRQEEL